MRPGKRVELVIEETIFPSIGIAKLGDREIQVKNAVEGEKVLVQITKKNRNKIEGKIVEVLERSGKSIEPLCPHSTHCGGCSHQHIPYEAQLKSKEKEVLNLFDKAGIRDFEYEGIEGSPLEFEYRNKMEFTFGNTEKGGPMEVGMHQSGKFYSIVPVEGCQIVDQDYRDLLTCIAAYCREKELSFYNKMSHQGFLRHLIIRKSFKKEEILINLVTSTQLNHDFTELIDRILNLSLRNKVVGFLNTKNDSKADTVTNEGYEILHGRDYIVEEILGLEFKISAFSFFQTNSLGAEKLYNIALDFLGDAEGKVIYDLYCGTGTITQILSQRAKKVYGIELVEEAIEAAKENAKLNNIDNVHFIAGDVGEKLKEIKERPDLIVVDPPRPGISSKALQQIIDYGVSEIVYVSCNPKTLVDNLQEMTQRGYNIRKIKLMDMFPHTKHVECVVLMSRVDK